MAGWWQVLVSKMVVTITDRLGYVSRCFLGPSLIPSLQYGFVEEALAGRQEAWVFDSQVHTSY
jgi:hypothetical protein